MKATKNNRTVDFFVKNYTEASNGEIQEKMIESIMKTKYVSFGLKTKIANGMINELQKDDHGLPYFSSPYTYLSFVMATLLLYTNFNLKKDKYVTDYDMLKARGILEKIFEKIPKSEFSEWQTIWQMTVDDFRENAQNPYRFFASQITRFGNIVGQITKTSIVSLKNTISEKLDDETIDKLKNELKKHTNK